MYLPRELISLLYTHLVRNSHSQSPPVTILVALEPDALCACHILTALLKRDYITSAIVPVSGYYDLEQAAEKHIQPMRTQNGGSGGTVICLGVGGLVDLQDILRFEATEDDADPSGGVEVWVIDARRPWNLGNVFGGQPPDQVLGERDGNGRKKQSGVSFGKIQRSYRAGRGGIVVFDDGDIETELEKEKEAYFALDSLPPIDDDGRESDNSESESEVEGPDIEIRNGKKRKSWSDADEENDSEDDDGRPRQRQRGNSVC